MNRQVKHVHDWMDWRCGVQLCMRDDVIDGTRIFCTARRTSDGHGGWRAFTDEDQARIDAELLTIKSEQATVTT